MAEILIKAKPHWMDAWDQATVDALSPEERAKYDARYQKGDVVEVFEDGWTDVIVDHWVCVKAPVADGGPTKAGALQYMEALLEDVGPAVDETGTPYTKRRTKYRRKWRIPPSVVDQIALLPNRTRTLTPAEIAQLETFLESKV